MKTAVQRRGHSLPRAFADETRIVEGSEVKLALRSGAPAVRKLPSLAALVKRITRANRHEAIPTGRAVGREAWV